MSDLGDDFRAMKEMGQEKRAANRESSPEALKRRGVAFLPKNNGAHLIVSAPWGLVDFWPGTGKFISRNPDKPAGRGVFKLLKHIKMAKETQ